MNILLDALRWLAVPSHWLGASGILVRATEHLGLTLLIVALAALIALPLGTWIGHTGRGRWLVSATGGARAVPTLGVLTLAGLWLGIGLAAPTLALLILAIPPLLSATYSGIASTPRSTVDAARAIGLTEPQVLAQVEAPHGGRARGNPPGDRDDDAGRLYGELRPRPFPLRGTEDPRLRGDDRRRDHRRRPRAGDRRASGAGGATPSRPHPFFLRQ